MNTRTIFHRLRLARRILTQGSKAVAADTDQFRRTQGIPPEWSPAVYADYYSTNVAIYAAIRLRADALARPPARIYGPDDQPVDQTHPAQVLLDTVNPWLTPGGLWRLTEIYLLLWGAAYWTIEDQPDGTTEIWPIRPDKMHVIPHPTDHIRGYRYQGTNGDIPYLPEDVIYLKYANPTDHYAGHSPMAPLRLDADSTLDATTFNRYFFKNNAVPNLIISTDDILSNEEMEDFYTRWEQRHGTPTNAHRPAIANFIKDIHQIAPAGFSHRDMDFNAGLIWGVEQAARVYGVPPPLLADYREATFANINTAERLFWRNTMVPELIWIQEELNDKLLPRLGYSGLSFRFDLSAIESLREDETARVERETKLLDAGVYTINEVRRDRNMPDVAWGNTPFRRLSTKEPDIPTPRDRP